MSDKPVTTTSAERSQSIDDLGALDTVERVYFAIITLKPRPE